MLLSTFLLQVSNDPFQALDTLVSNTFSKELLALAFVVVFVIAVGSIALRYSLKSAAIVVAIVLLIIHLEVGIDQPMSMPMMHLFVIGVVLAIIAFFSAIAGEKEKELKGMGHTGKTVARTQYQEW